MKTKIYKILLSFILILTGFGMAAQNTYLMNASTHNTTINTCSGTLYDSGGANGNYSSSENYTLTICSDNGAKVVLNVTHFDTESNYDYITIYDGPSTSGYPALVTQAGGTSLRGQTIESTNSCITLTWRSDGTTNKSGFAFEISCRYPCQAVEIGTITTTPPFHDVNGIKYIDICQGQTVNFSATGNYPQNNTNYNQSDATSTFSWSFGNGDTGNGNPASYTYNEERGYEIGLRISDVQNCSSGLENINMRVRVSTTPVFEGTVVNPNIICSGEFVNFTNQVETIRAEMQYGASRADTTFLPDGSGVAYYSDLTFGNFTPGQTVTSISDIQGILLNMEHSYLGDLSITIHCPSGQMCLLKGYNTSNPRGSGVDTPVTQTNVTGSISGSGIHLGWAPDPSSSSDPCYLTPGEGMDYWFTPTSTTPMGENGPVTNVTYIDPCGNSQSWNQLNSGEYGSYESMSTLIGCELNGTWTIEVRDNINQDNGYIFSWGIDFAQHLYPIAWDYQPQILSMQWSGENVSGNTASPTTPGTHTYTLEVTDDFGCTYDTTLTVLVRPFDDPTCCVWPDTYAGPDDQVCSDTYFLNASLADGNTGTWSVLNQPAGSGNPVFSAVNAPHAQVTVNGWGEYQFVWTEIKGNEACFDKDTVKILFYPVPTTTFTYTPIDCYQNSTTIQYTGNVDQFATYNWTFGGAQIVSGRGQGPYQIYWNDAGIHQVTLQVTANGCRSHDTTVNIQNPSLLTHQFAFENPSCALAANGWAEITPSGGTPPYNYSWASGTNRLPNLGQNNYTVTVTDANGCTTSEQFNIVDPPQIVFVDASYTDLACYNSNDGTITVATTGGSGAVTFTWSDIGMGPAVRTGLAAGHYQVMATDEKGCSVSQEFTLIQPEELLVSISPDMIICEGQQVSIGAFAVGGTSPYKYLWNDSNVESTNSSIIETPSTTTHYKVQVKDDHGCLSNQAIMKVTVSPRMVVENMIITNNKCYQSCDGRAEVVLTGGIAPFQYTWGSNNHIFNGICAGSYNLTITDVVGCETSTSFVITEPPQLVHTGNVEPVSCYGYEDGRATVFVQGGTPEYNYLWPDGTNTPTLTTGAGNYTVTVTDENNCRLTANFTITQPTELYVLPVSDRTICKGQSTTLSTQITGGTPPYDYRWTGSDGSTYNANDFVVNPLEPTTYNLTVYDANGCQNNSVRVNVNTHPDLAIISVTPDRRLTCPGEPVMVTMNITGGNGGPYILTLDDGRIVGNPFTVEPTETTTYNVKLSDMCGTQSVSDSFTVEVRPSPISNFTASTLEGCPPLSVQFNNESSEEFEYTWRFGDRNYSEQMNPQHIFTQPGRYSVSLEVSDYFGCKHVKTVDNMIYVYPKPTAIFEVNADAVSSINPEVDFINHSIDATSYFWSFGDGDSSINENPRHYYIGMGEFEVNLIAMNDFYCRDTATRIINVQNEFTFFAPTSFTPNGDGQNDCFRPCGNGISRNGFKFIVFDKWGNVIFETNKYDPDASCSACSEGSWDGTNNGRGDDIMPVGVYVWYCEFQDWNGITYTREGKVLLTK